MLVAELSTTQVEEQIAAAGFIRVLPQAIGYVVFARASSLPRLLA